MKKIEKFSENVVVDSGHGRKGSYRRKELGNYEKYNLFNGERKNSENSYIASNLTYDSETNWVYM